MYVLSPSQLSLGCLTFSCMRSCPRAGLDRWGIYRQKTVPGTQPPHSSHRQDEAGIEESVPPAQQLQALHAEHCHP